MQILTTTDHQSPESAGIILVGLADLKAIVVNAVRTALKESIASTRISGRDDERLSCSGVARMLKMRRQVVQHAMQSGALTALINGRRWSTTVADVRRWVDSGCPE